MNCVTNFLVTLTTFCKTKAGMSFNLCTEQTSLLPPHCYFQHGPEENEARTSSCCRVLQETFHRYSQDAQEVRDQATN
jgi:hypothetical protein